MEETSSKLKQSLDDLLKLYGIELDKEEGDFSEVIQKTQDQLDDLNMQSTELYKKIGMSPDELDAYASNPNNFSEEEWWSLQRVREEIENFKKSTTFQISEEPLQPARSGRKSDQKHKFGKKKNWIPL